jgi:Xaa-Pro aminopeptidase
MLTPEGCETRRTRLLRRMEEDRVDLFVTGNYRTIYYLTGSLAAPETPVAFALWSDGQSTLVTPETYSIDRVIDKPAHDAANLLLNSLTQHRDRVSTVAIERAGTPTLFEFAVRELWPDLIPRDATQTILELRKRKEPDEIAEIRESLRLIAVAYDAARAAIKPGRTELDIYNEMQSAVTQKAGTFVQLHGDFATGERAIRGGGPPTSRIIGPNDLYILDLFPAHHLYFGDTCRTFAAGTPTDAQFKAWEMVCEAMAIGEKAIKPGVKARDVYNEIKAVLDSTFWRHAGHGIGHNGHEAPRIIPGTDDIFEAGDVITLEPGISSKELHGGIRIEDNYIVHETGLENLFLYPKGL